MTDKTSRLYCKEQAESVKDERNGYVYSITG